MAEVKSEKAKVKSEKAKTAVVTRWIYFEDHGQDFLRWGIDDEGNVVKCEPFQGWIWCRMIVKTELLMEGQPVYYIDPQTNESYCIKYLAQKIEEVL